MKRRVEYYVGLSGERLDYLQRAMKPFGSLTAAKTWARQWLSEYYPKQRLRFWKVTIQKLRVDK